MRIGRDHIASTVYTIAFAYAGAALPILIIVMLYDRPLGDALTSAELSEEVIRTLVGSIGLVLAIPVTTLIAVLVVKATGIRTAGLPGRARGRRPRRTGTTPHVSPDDVGRHRCARRRRPPWLAETPARNDNAVHDETRRATPGGPRLTAAAAAAGLTAGFPHSRRGSAPICPALRQWTGDCCSNASRPQAGTPAPEAGPHHGGHPRDPGSHGGHHQLRLPPALP